MSLRRPDNVASADRPLPDTPSRSHLTEQASACKGQRGSLRCTDSVTVPGHLRHAPTCCLPGCLTIPTRFVSRNPAFPTAVPSGTPCDQGILSAVARHDISSEKLSSAVRLYKPPPQQGCRVSDRVTCRSCLTGGSLVVSRNVIWLESQFPGVSSDFTLSALRAS
jgi:hypothetical protein